MKFEVILCTVGKSRISEQHIPIYAYVPRTGTKIPPNILNRDIVDIEQAKREITATYTFNGKAPDITWTDKTQC